MTSRLNQPSGGSEEVAAARLQRRLEREYRARAQRRRAAIIVASLATAGVVLLGVGGVAMASRAEKASGDGIPTSAATVAEAPVPAQVTEPSSGAAAADKPVDEPALTAEPVAPEPIDPPVKPAAKRPKPSAVAPKKSAATSQRFTINIGDAGYEPSRIKASSASPITLTVGKGEGCAAGFTMPSLGIEKDNSSGPVTFSLGKLKAGTYRFACSMDMVQGTLVVK
jgi:plastocyanin